MPRGPVPNLACSCLGLFHTYLTCRQTPTIAYTPPCPASWPHSATRAEVLPGSQLSTHPHSVPSSPLQPPWPWDGVRVGGSRGSRLHLLGTKRYLLPNTSPVLS